MGRFFQEIYFKYQYCFTVVLSFWGHICFLFNIIRQPFAFALLLVSFSAMNIEELRKRDFFKCMLVIVV